MAKIVLPGRQQTPSGAPREVRVPQDFGQQQSTALGRLAAALQSVGGDFADIAEKAQLAQDRSDLAQAQIDYEGAIDKHLIDQEKDPDIPSWMEKTRTRHDEIVADLNLRTMSTRTKDQFNLWAQSQENNLFFKTATRSASLMAQNERKGLQIEMENAANHGRREDFKEHLDNMVADNNLLSSEREEFLKNYDNKVVVNRVLALSEAKEFDLADEVIANEEDPEFRRQLRSIVQGAKAAQDREQAANLKIAREQAYNESLINLWEGTLGINTVKDLMRDGLITPEAGKFLQDALKNPVPPTTSNEATIAVMRAINDIGDNSGTIEDALEIVSEFSGQIHPTDGKQFIKDIFGEPDTVNVKWDKEAWDYIEKQILNVSSMTGILFGSGEQIALSAQAHIAYADAVKRAKSEGKPIQGSDLLKLAHVIMYPFRSQVKPLFSGEEGEGALPATLNMPSAEETQKIKKQKDKQDIAEQKEVTRSLRTSRMHPVLGREDLQLRPELRDPSVKVRSDKPQVDISIEPKTRKEFQQTFNKIFDPKLRREYFDRWSDKEFD